MPDLRRVQKTGGSTLIVSLPKRWAETTGVKSGDTLSIIPGDRDSLIIDPHPTDKRTKRVKKLSIDGSDPEHFFRRLIAVYICGFDTIEVTSEEPMTTEMRASIRKFTRMVIGPEITEEDIRSVLMKDLSDPEGFGLRSVVRRIFRITYSMLKDALDAIRDGNEDVSRDVVSRDAEVDRFYWLLAKQFNLMLQKPRYLQDEPNSEESLNFFLIGRILERLADHAKIISDHHVTIMTSPGRSDIQQETLDLIVQAGELSLIMLNDSFEAFIKGDMDTANRAIDRTKDLRSLINDGISSISRVKPAITIPLSGMFESVQRTGMYSTDIAEIAINNLENS